MQHHAKSQSQRLTFTGLDALEPRVIKLYVAEISAFPEPSTPTSATAEFAGCLHSATFSTCGTTHTRTWYDRGRLGGASAQY